MLCPVSGINCDNLQYVWMERRTGQNQEIFKLTVEEAQDLCSKNFVEARDRGLGGCGLALAALDELLYKKGNNDA